jgi:heme/copper-type cytochrome/quinol oxidase subunit 4
MKNEILDEIEKEPTPPKYAIKSYDEFLNSIRSYAAIFLISLAFLLLGKGRVHPDFYLAVYIIFGVLGFSFNLLGISSYLSNRKNQETFTWKLLVGGIGNLLLFLASIWILFLSRIFDSYGF